MNKPLKIFITYARKDKEAKDKLITSLAVMKRQGLIEIWHDNEMYGGDRWQDEIFSKHLPSSDLLLYLVSADSLASENCYKELEIALDKEIKVIPIIFADCDWKNDQLSDLQGFPNNGTPINEWKPESKGWQNAVEGIRKVVNKMQSQADPSSGISKEELRAETFFGNGNILVMLGQLDDAIRAYSHAIDLNPNHADAYNNRGVAYEIKSEYDLAIKDDNTVIGLKPNYAEAYNNRGITYNDKGDRDLAIQDYTTAIKLNPDNAAAYYNRGHVPIRRQSVNLLLKTIPQR